MDDEVGIEVKKEDADYVRTITVEPLIKVSKKSQQRCHWRLRRGLRAKGKFLGWLLNFNYMICLSKAMWPMSKQVISSSNLLLVECLSSVRQGFCYDRDLFELSYAPI